MNKTTNEPHFIGETSFSVPFDDLGDNLFYSHFYIGYCIAIFEFAINLGVVAKGRGRC